MRPLILEKPWGYETILERNKWYTVKILDIEINHRTSEQKHARKVESIYVLSGSLKLWGKVFQPKEFVHIPAGTIHRFQAWQDDLRLLEVSHGVDADIIRYSDDYGRSIETLHQAPRSKNTRHASPRKKAKRNR